MSNRRVLIGSYISPGSAADFLGDDVSEILSIPYAHGGQMLWHEKQDMKQAGYDLYSINEYEDPREAVECAEAFMIGMGYTPDLLQRMREEGILELLKHRSEEGVPIMGASAGGVVLGPTINTTNDVIPLGMDLTATGVLPFHYNPHYPGKWGALAREEKLRELSERLQNPILGVMDPTKLLVEGNNMRFVGYRSEEGEVAQLFLPGQEPIEVFYDADLSFLLE